MTIDVSDPTKPGWWFNRMAKDLAARAPGYQLLDSYMSGESALPVATSKAVKESYQRLMRISRTNYAELVVEATRERMMPLGFRTGATDDDLGDKEAWRIWQANSLDADSGIGHRGGLSMGRFYVMVGGIDSELGVPVITLEDPREVITVQHPMKRRQSIAALKVFRDELYGVERAFVMVGGFIYRYFRQVPFSRSLVTHNGHGAGLLDGDWEEESFEPLGTPPNIIPVVEFTNRTKLGGREPFGEYETHLGLLDRINYTILNRVEIATLQAFKQRAIKGVPTHDAKGAAIDYSDVFDADPGAMWQLPDTADIWESGEVDLGPIRSSVQDDVQALAAVTRTPLFYLTADAANGSAEGASLARESLIFKVRDRLSQYGESWEQVLATAFAIAGDEARANRVDMEVIWANPEHFSLAERYDAAVKAQAAGVPWRQIMQDILQFSPQQIERMEAERAAEQQVAEAARAEAMAAMVDASRMIGTPSGNTEPGNEPEGATP
jgi:hypothetical protein